MKTRSDKKLIDLSDLDKIRNLASYGHTVKEIADIMGMSRETFYRRMAENPAINDTIKEGKSEGKYKLITRAHEMAMNGDREMMKYILSRVHGLTEKQVIEHRESVDVQSMSDEEIEERIRELEGY